MNYLEKPLQLLHMVHLKALLTSGLLIPLKAETLSKKLSKDLLPDDIPITVENEVNESSNPISSAAVKAALAAIRFPSLANLVFQVGGANFTYNPEQQGTLVLEPGSGANAGFVLQNVDESLHLGLYLPNASADGAGLMSAADFVKLRDINSFEYEAITRQQIQNLFNNW